MAAAGGAAAARGCGGVTSTEFSAPALFDLGNAWMRAGHPGWAILEYQRALVLVPHDPVVEQALTAARSRVDLGVVPEDIWQHAMGVLTDDAWAWIAAVSLLVLCIGLARLRLGRTEFWTRVVVLLAACGTLLAADAIALRWPEQDRAVVVRGGIAARIAPAPGAETTLDLREGQLVYLQDRFKDFERVRLPDGRSGWVSRGDVMPVRVTAAEAAAEARPRD